jgi:hypothetical protein
MLREALVKFTDEIMDRLAGTEEAFNDVERKLLAESVLDAFQAGLSVDEYFTWQESGEGLEQWLSSPKAHIYLQAWREAAIAEHPEGAICGRCKKDNDWYDGEGWYLWYPLDPTGKPDGLPPCAVCVKCLQDLGLPVTRGESSCHKK